MNKSPYQLEQGPRFRKALKKLTKKFDRRFKEKFLEKLEKIKNNPKTTGKPLKENLSGFWRTRLEDYRIIYDIDEENRIITLENIGHRSEIYD